MVPHMAFEQEGIFQYGATLDLEQEGIFQYGATLTVTSSVRLYNKQRGTRSFYNPDRFGVD